MCHLHSVRGDLCLKMVSCWCPEEVGLQVTFEELQGWLSSYDGLMQTKYKSQNITLNVNPCPFNQIMFNS